MSRRAEAGFSLIEAVVAMGLLAVALTAVYQLQAKSLDLHTDARFVTRATLLARDRVADVLSRPELEEGEASDRFEDDDGDLSGYTWDRRIREVEDHPGLYSVTVGVFLESAQGKRLRGVTYETLCYRRRP